MFLNKQLVALPPDQSDLGLHYRKDGSAILLSNTHVFVSSVFEANYQVLGFRGEAMRGHNLSRRVDQTLP